jgi:predicted permease
MHRLWQDLRYSITTFRKNPGFTVTAVLILALGTCASVTIFAFVDAALIRPLPYQNSSRLVGVFGRVQSLPQASLSYPDFLDFKNLNRVFTSIAAYQHNDFSLSIPAGAQPANGARVSDNFFRTLGITPVLGRDFYAGEDLANAPRTVLLSYEAWQTRYGGRSDVLNQTVKLDGELNTIVGVLPRDFHFAPAEPAEFWTTIHASGGCEARRGCHSFYGVARLKDGIDPQAAATSLSSITQQLEKQYPDSNRGQGTAVLSLTEVIVGNVRQLLLVLFAAAGLLLLIAGVNLTSLCLVRSNNRRQEIAIRCALGASRLRLIQQFVAEGIAVAAVGSTVGLICAYWLMQFLIKLIPAETVARMSFLHAVGLNTRVLMFAGFISLLAAALFSLTLASSISLAEIREGLAESSRGSAGNTWRRLGSKLVMLELATAMVLLVSAGLLAQSFYRLLHVNIGFQPTHLATLDVSAPMSKYHQNAQLIGLEQQIMTQIGSLPGVESVGIGRLLPVGTKAHTSWYRVLGRPYYGEHDETPDREVSSGYLTTLGAKLLRGRYFTENEDDSKPLVAIINQTMARKYFPGEDPINKQISYVTDPPVPMEIVGVVEDVKEGPLDTTTPPVVYLPFNQHARNNFSVVVRTSQAESSLLPFLSAAVHQIDPDITTSAGATMSDLINSSPAADMHRSLSWLIGGFAAMAALLGGVGLYGVIAYSVSQRTREIGIRMALGAQRRAIRLLVVKQAVLIAAAGVAIGLGVALILTRLLTTELYEISPSDPVTLIAAAIVLIGVALLACYLPARRATKVDPLVALRYE